MPTVHITIRIDEDLKDRADKVAQEEQRDMSFVLRRWMAMGERVEAEKRGDRKNA